MRVVDSAELRERGPGPLELLQALIRFDTSNPPGNERPCLEYVAKILSDAGIEHRFLALEDDRPNLLAWIRGRGDAPPLLLYAHVDVVPASAREWAHAPFAADIADGSVWGRGALDMKSGVAMLVTALVRLAALDPPPAGNVILALTSDEETGSRSGMRFLVEQHPEEFTGVRYALSEEGGFTQWHADRRFFPIQVAEKQRCVVRATVRGAGGHAASGVRATAAQKLGHLLTRLTTRRLPVHVTPAVAMMVREMAAAFSGPERIVFRALMVPTFTDRVLDILGRHGVPFDPILHNTATPTVFRSGIATNVVPTELTVDLDGRVLPGMRPHDLLRELESLAHGLAEFELVHEEPAAPSDPDLGLFPLLADVLRRRDPSAVPIPMVLPAYTDARHVSRLGIQTYGFLPMRLPRGITMSLMHAPNERVPVDAVDFGADCLVEVIKRYK
jgi:acetylornithine deacetylase/succinyl-diaminopimelate desuccinylase-like protein